MGARVVRQAPDGDWYAEDPDGTRGRIEDVTGWDAVLQLLRAGDVVWESPNSISRFRAQFGEPPQDEALLSMHVGPA